MVPGQGWWAESGEVNEASLSMEAGGIGCRSI